MGFPYDEQTWSVVDGAMFIGWGGITPGVYTLIGAAICVAVLWLGNQSEKTNYKRYDQ